MSRRRVQKPDNSFKGFRWVECFIDTAVNPRTKRQVTLTAPIQIRCFEDFAKFNDQWEKFCTDVLIGDPDEVCFTLDLTGEPV